MSEPADSPILVSSEDMQLISMLAEDAGMSTQEFTDDSAVMGLALAKVVLEHSPAKLNICFETEPAKLDRYPLNFGDWDDISTDSNGLSVDEMRGTSVGIDDLPSLSSPSDESAKELELPLSSVILSEVARMSVALEVLPDHFMDSSIHYRWQWGVAARKRLNTYIKWTDGSFTKLRVASKDA